MHTGELRPSKVVLRSYSNHKIKPVGVADLTVKHKNHTTTEFELVNIVQESVLSDKTAEALGLIVRLDSLKEVSETQSTPVRDNAPTETLPKALGEFPELAQTTGTLPGKYTIKIEPIPVPGVPVRRQPAALKEKIMQKLHEMAKNGHLVGRHNR